VRSPRGGVSLRVPLRAVLASLGLLVVLLVVGVFTMTTGDFPIAPVDVVTTLLGQGTGASDFIVLTLRLPRLLTAVLVGAALAASGAILQSLSRNALASPDVIGFTNGAATGAILVIVVFHGSMLQTSIGAITTGLITSLAVYLLARKRGVQGFRLVLIGVGVSSFALAINSYLLTRVSLESALTAQAWLVGSLNGRGWDQVQPLAAALAVLFPLTAWFSRRLAVMEMGDSVATGLGVDVERSRFGLILTSVGLAAVATAAAGPIAFVALASPQLARRLTAATGPGVLSSALMGALLLVASDLAVQRIFAPAQLPVGIATGAIGGLYLIWLLATEWRRGVAR
jgi:iron complex transport system permease protein